MFKALFVLWNSEDKWNVALASRNKCSEETDIWGSVWENVKKKSVMQMMSNLRNTGKLNSSGFKGRKD